MSAVDERKARVDLLGLLAAGVPTLLAKLTWWVYVAFEYDLSVLAHSPMEPIFIAFGVYGEVLLIGAPLAWLLHRRGVTSIAAFGLGGALAGAISWSLGSGYFLAFEFEAQRTGHLVEDARLLAEIWTALHASAVCGAIGGMAYILVNSAAVRRRAIVATRHMRRTEPPLGWIDPDATRPD